MDRQSMAERCRGALIGMAVGSAMGLPADGLSAYEILRTFQMVDNFYPVKGGEAGRYGYGAQLSLIAAQSICEAGVPDSDAYERRFKSAPLNRKMPDETRQALDKLKAGYGLEGSAPHSGYGDLLPRMAAVGLWASATKPENGPLLRACRLMSYPTQRSRHATAAGFVVARVVMECIANFASVESPYALYASSRSLLARMEDEVRQIESVLSPDEMVGDRLWMRIREVRGRLERRATPEEIVGLFGNGPDVHNLLPTALFCFAKSPDDFKSVCSAASLGGACSLRGAVVGAMCGAFSGEDFLPADMREQVENAPSIMTLGETLAERLC